MGKVTESTFVNACALFLGEAPAERARSAYDGCLIAYVADFRHRKTSYAPAEDSDSELAN